MKEFGEYTLAAAVGLITGLITIFTFYQKFTDRLKTLEESVKKLEEKIDDNETQVQKDNKRIEDQIGTLSNKIDQKFDAINNRIFEILKELRK
jgi:uncharacterized protein YoxC